MPILAWMRAHPRRIALGHAWPTARGWKRSSPITSCSSASGLRTRLYVQGREPAGAAPPLASLVRVGGTPARLIATADSSDPLTDDIRIAPVFKGDAVRALEVYANTRSAVFSALGLEPGDRITAIDGVAVTDAAEATRAACAASARAQP